MSRISSRYNVARAGTERRRIVLGYAIDNLKKIMIRYVAFTVCSMAKKKIPKAIKKLQYLINTITVIVG